MSNLVKEAGKKAIEKIILTTIEELSKALNELVKNYIVEVYQNNKKRNLKYNSLRELYLSSDTKFEELQQAIIETKKIVSLFKSDLDILNKKNPIDYVKYQFLIKEYSKWHTLLLTLKTEITVKIHDEVYSMYFSKEVSNFFEKHPDINDQIINLETRGQLNNLLLDIKKYYLDGSEQG